jgi:hypothetical protein
LPNRVSRQQSPRYPVEPMPPLRVVNDFLADAAAAVEEMADDVAAIAIDFRRDELTSAQDGLSRLTANLREFVVMVGVLRGPLEIDADRLTVSGVSLGDQIARLSECLQSMIDAQASRDWLAIADLLERDLQPFLRGWPATLLACRRRVQVD